MTRAPGAYVWKDVCLPREVFHAALGSRVRLKLAEGRVIDPDRMKGVSRRHMSRRRNEPHTLGRTHPGKGPNGAHPNGVGK